jgi:hypothetical protein
LHNRRKADSQGAKIRGTYAKWALGEKKRIEDDLKTKKAEVADKERSVEDARSELLNPLRDRELTSSIARQDRS